MTKTVADPEDTHRFQGRLKKLEESTEGQQTLIRLRKSLQLKTLKAEKVLGENTRIVFPFLHSSLNFHSSAVLETV